MVRGGGGGGRYLSVAKYFIVLESALCPSLISLITPFILFFLVIKS